MSIIEAASAMVRGLSVRRAAWPEGVFVSGKTYVSVTYGKKTCPFTLTVADLTASDWEIHVPKPERAHGNE